MSKVYIVLYNSAACELARHETVPDATDGSANGDYTQQTIRWLGQDHIVLNAGDSIHFEEAP